MTAFAEPSDVREAIQEYSNAKGKLDDSFVIPALKATSRWFARQTNGHWYDSNKSPSDEIDSTNASATEVQLDVPSSPHRQDRQLISDTPWARYPVAVVGPYAKIKLPHPYVTSITKLDVRGLDGDVEDWVAGSFTEGKGEDYYIERKGQDSYGRTHLYINTRSIGARENFTNLLTVEYEYGLDYQDEEWDDVLRGIACLSGAEVIDEDDVLSQIPDSGTLVGLDTQHTNLVNEADRYLEPYLSAMG